MPSRSTVENEEAGSGGLDPSRPTRSKDALQAHSTAPHHRNPPRPWRRLIDVVTPETAALLDFDVDEVLAAAARRPLPRLTASGGRR